MRNKSSASRQSAAFHQQAFQPVFIKHQLCDGAPSFEATVSFTSGTDVITGLVATVFAQDGLRAVDDLRFAADFARVVAAFAAFSAFFNSFTSPRAAFAAFFANLWAFRACLKTTLASCAFFLARSDRFSAAEIWAAISADFVLTFNGLLGVFFIESRMRGRRRQLRVHSNDLVGKRQHEERPYGERTKWQSSECYIFSNHETPNANDMIRSIRAQKLEPVSLRAKAPTRRIVKGCSRNRHQVAAFATQSVRMMQNLYERQNNGNTSGTPSAFGKRASRRFPRDTLSCRQIKHGNFRTATLD